MSDRQHVEDDDMHENGRQMPDRGTVVRIGLRDDLPDGTVSNTELANAHRLCRDYGDRLLFVDGMEPHVWNGSNWTPSRRQALRLAHDVTRGVLFYARELNVRAARLGSEARKELEEEARKLEEHARRSQHSKPLHAVLEIAAAFPELTCTVEQLDSDPMLFACRNGTINLLAGDLHPARPGDRISKVSPVVFDRDAACPQWTRFLKQILVDDELIQYLQRLVGYCLTGSTEEQCLHIFHGAGANGKSVLLEVLRYVFGTYAQVTPVSSLIASNKGELRNDIARLAGARFVTASETAEDTALDEALIKSITGGDRIVARFLRQEFFEFDPVAKIFIATNHLPRVRGNDHGIWRRLRLLDFRVKIEAMQMDVHLLEKLKAEGPGVLAWAVRGCLDWQSRGLCPPPTILAASEDWRQESNVVARFVEERCRVSRDARVTAAELYAAFTHWVGEEGECTLSKKAFGMRLRDLAFAQDRTGQARFWLGLSLRMRGYDG